MLFGYDIGATSGALISIKVRGPITFLSGGWFLSEWEVPMLVVGSCLGGWQVDARPTMHHVNSFPSEPLLLGSMRWISSCLSLSGSCFCMWLGAQDPVLSGTDWGSISATATGLIVSGSLAGALLGSALAFLVADPLGKKCPLSRETWHCACVCRQDAGEPV